MKDGEAIGEAIIALMSQLLENQSTIRMVFAAAPSQNEMPIDIVCLGIGENGHITFNAPPVANFHDPAIVKRVELDLACQTQQVHEGAKLE